MISTANRKRVIGLAVTTAMAGALLSGCTTSAAPRADVSASRAEAALARGQNSAAIQHAEAAVLAEPRNATYRSTLGAAYLDAGRFASAETTLKDAIELGDNTARNALSLSLALSAQGKYPEAQALLSQWEGEIATADLGLALSLAGQPERGIQLMSNAIRSGENTPKMRQNLAYSYALAGRWRDARIMAAQDVPAAQLDERITKWALMATPEGAIYRIAALLNVPAGVRDAGQPVELALANNPSIEQLANAAAPTAPAPALAAVESTELPPLAVAPAPASVVPVVQAPAPAAVEPVRYEAPPAARNFESAFTANSSPLACVEQDAGQFRRAPVVQPVRERTSAVTPSADGTHLVQLGSFSSEAGAQRAWGIYVKKYPELAGHQMVISEAVVRGKHYWRVSAAGFGRSTSSAMCGRVRSNGSGCFAYAEGRPLPGAIDTGVRLARRD